MRVRQKRWQNYVLVVRVARRQNSAGKGLRTAHVVARPGMVPASDGRLNAIGICGAVEEHQCARGETSPEVTRWME
jgi:hypothetical protein